MVSCRRGPLGSHRPLRGVENGLSAVALSAQPALGSARTPVNNRLGARVVRAVVANQQRRHNPLRGRLPAPGSRRSEGGAIRVARIGCAPPRFACFAVSRMDRCDFPSVPCLPRMENRHRVFCVFRGWRISASSALPRMASCRRGPLAIAGPGAKQDARADVGRGPSPWS